MTNWATQLQRLSALPQICCKLSGLVMFDHNWTPESTQQIVATCLEQFGPDRCMFGSNFSEDKLYSDYVTVIAKYLTFVPQKNQETIFKQTAAKFYSFRQT